MPAMGRAMMSRPKLLMLDEPSMGLSPLMMKRIMSTVSTLQQRGHHDPARRAERPGRAEASHARLRPRVGKIVLEGSGSGVARLGRRPPKAYLGED